MSNFDYISTYADLSALHQATVEAENLQITNPRTSAQKCKQALTELCLLAMHKLNIVSAPQSNLSDLLDNEALTTELSNMDILRQMRQVRRRSNAAQNLGEDLEGMPYVVELLYHIVGTLLMSFGYIKQIPEYVPAAGVSFDIVGEPAD